MLKKLRFRLKYRRLKKMPNPLKIFADECATRFSYYFSKDEQRDMQKVGRLIDDGFDLKNTIDDYGRDDAPEQPPFDAEQYEKMKRIRRNNFLLMIAFILCEGSFNYFALKAMMPGQSLVIEIIRIATAVIISLMALFLVENFILSHFHYLMLKHQDERTREDERQLIRLKAKRRLYLAASIILAIVLIALGIIREFIIAGGATVNLWIMLVTVGLAIIVAIALGLQGAEVTEIIHKYKRMVKWQHLKYRIDQTERAIRDRLDLIHRKIEEDINNEWSWMHYLKMWLLREFDDDDKDKSVEEKKQLVYTNYGLFKEKLLSQSEETSRLISSYENKYDQLISYCYSLDVGRKA